MTCPKCGEEMNWLNDYSFEDMMLEGIGIITMCECMHCGTWVEIYIPEKNPYEEGTESEEKPERAGTGDQEAEHPDSERAQGE